MVDIVVCMRHRRDSEYGDANVKRHKASVAIKMMYMGGSKKWGQESEKEGRKKSGKGDRYRSCLRPIYVLSTSLSTSLYI